MVTRVGYIKHYNHLPIADTGDCTEGVTVTVIGVVDVPPVILTTTSTDPDDSEPLNCPDVNCTTNPLHINEIVKTALYNYNQHTYW